MTSLTTQGLAGTRPSRRDIKRYAGKVALDEVFVVDWGQEDDLTHSVGVLWPRRHAFYIPAPHRYTLLLFTESVRQSLAVATHLGLGVPVGHRMGWERLSCSVSPDALAIGPDPAAIEMTITYTLVERRRSGIARMAARIRAVRDGMLLGTALVRYAAYPPTLYDRLRGDHADAREAFARALPPGPAADPALVGRTDPHDVVLAPEASRAGNAPRDRWTLRTDTSHTVLYDHPHDHIPGMVLLEAVSQAAQAAAAPRNIVLTGFDTSFSRYVEFDLPCTVHVDEPEVDAGLVHQRVSGFQGGESVFASEVTGIVEEVRLPRQRKYQAVRE